MQVDGEPLDEQDADEESGSPVADKPDAGHHVVDNE